MNNARGALQLTRTTLGKTLEAGLMSGFDEFRDVMTREVARLVSHSRFEAAMEYSIGNALESKGSIAPPPTLELAPDEEVIRRLYIAVEEIATSVQSMRNVAIYVRRFPYARAGVDKADYLRYHVENYLNELYILKQRTDAFLNLVARLYKSDRDSESIKRATGVIKRHLSGATEGRLSRRHGHVHRYRYDDPDLSRLAMFRLLSTLPDLGFLSYEKVYRQVRRAKRDWIERTNQSVEALLDDYFAILGSLMFDESGRFRNPRAAQQRLPAGGAPPA